MKKFFFLFFILFCAFFLRIYKLDDWFYFNMDEALLAFRGWGLWQLGRFFIIGGISPLGFHLPPYFYWFSAAFLPLLNFDPIIWGYLGAFLSLATIFFLFILVKKIAGEKTAYVSVLIYTFSFLAIFFDRHYWPLNLNPLFTILTLLLLTADIKKKWLFLALLLVFALSADPSNFPLLVLVILSAFPFKKKLSSKLKASMVFFVLFFLPLVIFDIRHSGSNLQGISRLFNKINQEKIDLTKTSVTLILPARVLSQFWYSQTTNISHLHTYCSEYVYGIRMRQTPVLQFLAAFLLLLYCLLKIKSKSQESIFVKLILIYYTGVIFYGIFLNGSLFEHYLAGLLPVFAFLTAKILVRFWVGGFFILIIFILLNLTQYKNTFNDYGLKSAKKAVDWSLSQLVGQPFALDVVSECFRYNGLRYLYEIKGKPPQISFIDPQFFWLYKNKPAQIFPDKVIVFTDRKVFFNQPVVAKEKFDAWEVYILDNRDKNYQIEGL